MNNQMGNFQMNNGQMNNGQIPNQSKKSRSTSIDESKKKLIISIIGLAIVLVAIIGISFATYKNVLLTNPSEIQSGSVAVSFTESNNSIDIKNAIPVTDETGKNSSDNSFDFAVTTTAEKSTTVPYTISVTTDNNNTLDDSYVKVNLLRDGLEVVKPSLISELQPYSGSDNSKVLYNTKDIFSNGESEKITHYTLKLWVDKDFEVTDNSNKTYKLRVNVNSLMSKE